jgi:hypothetical protein
VVEGAQLRHKLGGVLQAATASNSITKAAQLRSGLLCAVWWKARSFATISVASCRQKEQKKAAQGT